MIDHTRYCRFIGLLRRLTSGDNRDKSMKNRPCTILFQSIRPLKALVLDASVIVFVKSIQTCKGVGLHVFSTIPCKFHFYRATLCVARSYRNSVRPSVRPSVTLVDCVHMVRPTIMISSTQGSPIILVSGDITFIPKFEGGHHAPGR